MESPETTQLGAMDLKIRYPQHDLVIEAHEIGPTKNWQSYEAKLAWMFQGNPLKGLTRVNIGDDRAKSSYRTALNRLLQWDDYGINLDRILEDISTIIQNHIEICPPALLLSEVEAPENVDFLIDNLLIEGGVTIIYADGSTGKSYFSLFLACLCQEAYSNSDYKLSVQPSNVLFVDWETTAESMKRRHVKVLNGLGISDEKSIHYMNPKYPLVNILPDLRYEIEQTDADLVILDSMGYAMKGELESQVEVSEFFRAVNSIVRKDGRPVTKLLVSHVNKNGGLFGSQYTYNSARLVWEAKKTKGTGSSIDFSLFCRKANDVPEQAHQSWNMKFDGNSVKFSRQDVFETDAKGAMSYSDLVREILIHDGVTNSDHLLDVISEAKQKHTESDRREVKSNIATAISKHVKALSETGHGIKRSEDGSLEFISGATPDRRQEDELL